MASTVIPGHCDLDKLVRNRLGVKYCILGGSGRALLSLLLERLYKKGGERRNEVLLPGYTCYSVAAAVARAGLKISLYDISLEDFSPQIDSVKRAAGSNTLAIVAQHLFGIPTVLDELQEVALTVGCSVIEDSAQALGGKIDGKLLGTIGDFGLFSFGRGKPLPLGCGGALVAKDSNVIDEIRIPQGSRGCQRIALTGVVQILAHPAFYWMAEMLPLGLGITIFDPNFTVSSFPQAMKQVGVKAFHSLASLNDHRISISRVYMRSLNEYGRSTNSERSNMVCTRFPVVAGSKPIPKVLHRLGVRRMYPEAVINVEGIAPFLSSKCHETPYAERIAKELVTLPTHSGISKELALKISNHMRDYYFA